MSWRAWLAVVIGGAAAGVFAGAAITAGFFTSLPISEHFRHTSLGIAALIGVILLFRRVRAADRTAAASERSAEAAMRSSQAALATSEAAIRQASEAARTVSLDRFERALERLGGVQVTQRVGAIHSLEEIAKVSPDLHPTVFEYLASFLRDKVPMPTDKSAFNKVLQEQSRQSIKVSPARQLDIAAALRAIARRDSTNDPGDAPFINLAMTNLDGAQVDGGDLSRVILFRCPLRKAAMRSVKLSEANLGQANLQGARLQGADFRGIGNISGAMFHQANLDGAKLQGVDLSDVDGLTREQIAKAEMNDQTKLPA